MTFLRTYSGSLEGVWIEDLTDTMGPVVTDRDPAPGEVGVGIDSSIYFRIADASIGLDVSATTIQLDGSTIWSADGPVVGWSGLRTYLGDGVHAYLLQKDIDLLNLHNYVLDLHAADLNGNILDVSWGFRTADATVPEISNRYPMPGATGVPSDTAVSFDATDAEGNLNPFPTIISIDAQVVWEYGMAAPGFVVTVIPILDGYHYLVAPTSPFAIGDIVVVGVHLEDSYGNQSDGYWQFRTANALIELLQGPYEITLDAFFSGPMLPSSLTDASLYALTGGAYVRNAEPLPIGDPSPTAVRLWVEGFQGEGPFTLTVSSLVRDSSGDALAPSGRTAQISPFQSLAYLSNTSGRVRSWHASALVMKDSLRVYLTGARGMDVFDVSGGLGRPLRWAQILDGYGFGAACVSGTADYAFGDTDPPFLANRSPAPGQTGVPLGTDIAFSVADQTTSVEVTAVAVYVNSRLAFDGLSGWSGGFGGRISVRPQVLDIQLYPPVGAIVVGTNTVSVVAMDFVGNLLDTSYTFTVGALPPVSSGFGTGDFGIAPFGE
jgi:hypothetical protein